MTETTETPSNTTPHAAPDTCPAPSGIPCRECGKLSPRPVQGMEDAPFCSTVCANYYRNEYLLYMGRVVEKARCDYHARTPEYRQKIREYNAWVDKVAGREARG